MWCLELHDFFRSRSPNNHVPLFTMHNCKRMIYYKRLLLIDDDQDDHEFFLEAIQEIDSSITCAAFFDGEQALRHLRNNAGDVPDLIILDTNMPKLNGRQILAELKRIPNLKGVPVVMYSTFFSDRDNVELTNLGAMHYLSKPSRFEEFRSALKEILESKIVTRHLEEEGGKQ
jgi:DNA-binding response OmpR family regulator